MVNLIRRFQQPLMIFITVIIIIAFAWLYNDNSYLDRMGSDRVGKIYGRTITQAQFGREGRKYELCQYLNRELWESLIQPAQTQDEAIQNYVWNTMILRHEAERLGIAPSESEIMEAIKAMPAFRTNDTYDSNKYNLFVSNALAPRGLSGDALEELASDGLRLERTKALLGSTVAPANSELRSMFELRNTKFETSLIRWKFDDFLKDQKVSDEDVKAAYEERKKTLLTEEQRKVKFVAFTLPTAEKPLVGKERADALSPLSNKAEEFAVAMTDKAIKFDELAAKLGVKVEETPAFTADEPPTEIGKEQSVAAAAFKLSKEQPNSDPIQTEKGYYILQLGEIIPAREKTLDEAKTALAETLKNERATEAMTLKATEVRNKIDADLKAGKSFADATTAAGVTAETFPPFSFSEPPTKEPDFREVMMAMRDLKPGQLSSFQTTGMSGVPSGGLLVFLDKKQPVDDAKYALEKPMLAEQFARGMREAVFQQWFKLRRAEAQIQTANVRS